MQDSDYGRGGTRRLIGVLLPVLLLLLIGYGMYLGTAVYGRTRPLPQAVGESPGRAYEKVALDSCDETVLAGWYRAGENGAAIILLHDEGETRAAVAAEATLLAEAGYGVLLYDRRGHGESSSVLRAGGWDDLGDVYNAWDWLAARPEVDEERIGIYGRGVGGQIALRAAAFSRRIFAVAAADPAVATDADRAAAGPRGWNERLIFQGMAWRTGVPEPLPVVDVIGDIAPRPVLLLAAEKGEGTVVSNYYTQAREPKSLTTGDEMPALVQFFDTAVARGEVAGQ